MIRATVEAWLADDAPGMGAALAFYTLFSIAPLLLIAMSVAGLVFSEATVRDELVGQLTRLLGPDSARAVDTLLQGLRDTRAGRQGVVVGALGLLLGATSVLVQLQRAMDRIWPPAALPHRPQDGLWNFVRMRLLALGLVLGLGFLMLVSLLLNAALAALGRWWAPCFGNWVTLARALDGASSLGFVAAVVAMLYRWLPRVHLPWRAIWPGALFTALMFTLGKWLIGLYIGHSGVASVFGAAASLVVLLLWVYFAALVFLLGAELTRSLAQRARPWR